MKLKKFSKSVRKYIRQEKARIRREVLNSEKREELIQQLYKKFDKNISSKKESSVPKKKTITKVVKKTKIMKVAKKIKAKKSVSKDK